MKTLFCSPNFNIYICIDVFIGLFYQWNNSRCWGTKEVLSGPVFMILNFKVNLVEGWFSPQCRTFWVHMDACFKYDSCFDPKSYDHKYCNIPEWWVNTKHCIHNKFLLPRVRCYRLIKTQLERAAFQAGDYWRWLAEDCWRDEITWLIVIAGECHIMYNRVVRLLDVKTWNWISNIFHHSHFMLLIYHFFCCLKVILKAKDIQWNNFFLDKLDGWWRTFKLNRRNMINSICPGSS